MSGFLARIAMVGLVLVAFSGCLSSDGEPEGTAGTGGAGETNPGLGSETPGGTGTSAPTGEPMPPVLVVVLTLNGTELVAENGSFVIPAEKNITFDASGTSDPEGGVLIFAWDFGDGNTSDLEAVDHAWSTAGNYTTHVTVTDPDNMTATASYAFVVESTGPASGAPLPDAKLRKTGTYTVAVQTGTPFFCAGATSGVAANALNTFDIPAVDEATGAYVAITKMVITLAGGTTTIDQAIQVKDPKGKVTDVDAGPTAPNGGETVTLEGPLPTGTYTIGVYGCVAVNGSWTLDAVATRVVA